MIFTRVSSKEQREEGFSLEAQIDLLRAYCARLGLDVVEEVVIAESAKDPLDRKKFDRMCALVRKGGIGHLVVEKVDRIYRTPHDWVKIEALHIDLHLVKQGAVINDRSTSHEKFLHGLHVLMAKHYVDNLGEETVKGMTRKAKEGLWPSAAPIGYRNVVEGGRRLIEPDPERAPLVLDAYRIYSRGDASMEDVVAVMRARGLVTKKGGKLTRSHLHQILHNPIYRGAVVWDGEEYPGVHGAIVPRDLWEKVQRVMDGKHGALGGGHAAPEFAYRGLVRCGVCGCAASPYRAKGIYVYYACSGARGCRRQGVREEAVTEAVAKVIEGMRIRPAVVEALRSAIKEGHAGLLQDQATQLHALEIRRKEASAKVERLYLDKLSGDVPASVYPKLKAEWEGDLAAIEAEMAAHGPAHRKTWDDSLALVEAVSNSAPRFRQAKPDARRNLFRAVVSNCQIMDGKVTLEVDPRFELVRELNREGVEDPLSLTALRNWLPDMDSNHD